MAKKAAARRHAPGRGHYEVIRKEHDALKRKVGNLAMEVMNLGRELSARISSLEMWRNARG